jgi:hypothetical protein
MLLFVPLDPWFVLMSHPGVGVFAEHGLVRANGAAKRGRGKVWGGGA